MKQKNRTFLTNSLLVGVALVLMVILWPLQFITVLIRIVTGKAMNGYLYRVAESLDQHGNAAYAHTLNFLFAKKEGWQHGDEDETISFVIGINKRNGHLTVFGRFIELVLDLIDAGHCEKAIKSQKTVGNKYMYL